MKILKIIGIIVALLLLIGLLLPKKHNYESSIDISAPKELIFSKLNNLKEWEKWGPWAAEDPSVKITYGDKTEGVGGNYSYSGEVTGNGKITVTEITPSTSLKSDIEFEGKGKHDGYFKLEDGESSATKATWGMNMNTPFPFNIMMLFMGGSMKKNITDMLASGLGNLKTLCEKEAATPPTPAFNVQRIGYPGKNYLAIRKKVKMANIQAFYSKNLGAIMKVVENKKVQTDGMPTGIYYTWDPQKGETDMAAAIPVKDLKLKGFANMQTVEVPAGAALLIDYKGGYSGLEKAHQAMTDYVKTNALKEKGPVLEEYVTDPGAEPDSNNWLTKIYYFYEK